MANEEVRARTVLAEMQMRISQGPHSALAIDEGSSAEAVRAAFLQLTKQFHPARFGRMANDVQRLANEVFLGIKAAHDQLTRLLGSSGRVAPIRQQVTADGSNKTRISSGTQPPLTSRTRTATSPPAIVTAARSSRPIPVRRSAPIPVQSPPRETPGRPDHPSATGIPVQRPTPSGGMPVQRPTPSGAMPVQRPTPSGGMPVQRPAQRPTPPMGIPVQSRTTTPITPSPRRPSNPLEPSTIRYSGVQPVPTQPLPRASTPQPPGASMPAFDEATELQRAMELLAARNWTAARPALHALAAKVPQSKHYRALLCYTRGREAQSSGRTDEALLEFQRAVQLDPDLEVASQALGELQRRRW